MKDCVAVINQKGGVGKTTTVNALGADLYFKGYKVLYIDMDAQGNLSYSLGVTSADYTVMDVITGSVTVNQAIVQTRQGDLLASDVSLSSADILLTETGKEYRLYEALEPVKRKYNYILIDTPPSLGILTVNALTACTDVIIVSQADTYSLQGIGQLSRTIQTVKRYCNRNLKIKGILVTRYNPRTILSRDMLQLTEEIADQLQTKVFNTKIRECNAVKESQASQKDIFTYSPRCNGAKDYSAFTDEFLTL